MTTPPGGWHTVARLTGRFEAEIVAARLRDGGFEAFVAADDAGGWEPQLALVATVEVKVPADDAAEAEAFLAEEAD